MYQALKSELVTSWGYVQSTLVFTLKQIDLIEMINEKEASQPSFKMFCALSPH